MQPQPHSANPMPDHKCPHHSHPKRNRLTPPRYVLVSEGIFLKEENQQLAEWYGRTRINIKGHLYMFRYNPSTAPTCMPRE